VSRRGPPPERRHNYTLREILEEFVGHARDVAARTKAMTSEELEQAQERLEWLADEVWRIATTEEQPPE
jgi:DNA gyrase/topoisomerase IV subunit A